ncbi:MAG: winged helix-turn-helix transcriptional regulator [Peptococcaceae bacterium]|nr:winged helix-turn-helix transcriptional regulator [Peptococcaceae bacterium]
MLDNKDICIQIKAILRSVKQIKNSELALFNLTGAEGDIIFQLLSASDGLSQEKLAERLDIDKSDISKTVNSLRQKGYIRRERQTDDFISFRVILTDAAKEISPAIEYVYKTVCEVGLQGINETELQILNGLLNKVYRNLRSWEPCSYSR